MARIHANNYETTLNGAILIGATSMTVTSVTGLPAIGAGVTCNLTIEDGGIIEIVKATAVAGFVITIVRAQEDTSASAYASGSTVTLRATRDSIDSKQDTLSAASLTAVTVASTDKVLIQDVSDSDNLKTVTAQSIADLAAGSSGTVPAGGTGLTSATPYAVLCGGTTTTGALQYIASVGTAGQVLTSNGAGALPTMQAPSSGSGAMLGITSISGSNNLTEITFTSVALAVNALTITNAVAGSNAYISATGTDTNLSLQLNGKGGRGVLIGGGGPGTKKLSIATSAGSDGIDIWQGLIGDSTSTACGLQGLVQTNNVSATGNSVFGYLAGSAVTTGANNTLMGVNSGAQLSSGSSNTCIGASTQPNTNGSSFNTCLGASSGGGAGSNTCIGALAGGAGASGGVALSNSGGATDNSLFGYRATVDINSAVGCLALGEDAVAHKATGTTSITHGPGIAIGSAAAPVGFRGDATIYSAVGASAGYWRVKINGTHYKINLFADA